MGESCTLHNTGLQREGGNLSPIDTIPFVFLVFCEAICKAKKKATATHVTNFKLEVPFAKENSTGGCHYRNRKLTQNPKYNSPLIPEPHFPCNRYRETGLSQANTFLN